MVAQSTGVSIVTVGLVGHEGAHSILAGVVGAGILVIARDERAGNALPIDAGVIDRARITIIARPRSDGIAAPGQR